MQRGAPVLVTCRQKWLLMKVKSGRSPNVLAKASLLAALSGAMRGAKN